MIDLTDDWFNRRNSINDVIISPRHVRILFDGMFFVELLIVIVTENG